MVAVPYHERIADPAFRQAIALMDAGEAKDLRAHLDAHGDLVQLRVSTGEDGYFSEPYLLEFVAENPIRNGHMPENVVDVATVVIEGGTGPEAIQATLGLVSSGRIAREEGKQGDLIATLCQAGADPNEAMMAALGHGELEAANALVSAGAAKSLPWAAATGDMKLSSEAFETASCDDRHAALALASQLGQAETLQLLLLAGEDPSRYNPPSCHMHTTPLHQAAFYGHLSCVKVLVAAGADITLTDTHHNASAESWARHASQEEIANFLASRAADDKDH